MKVVIFINSNSCFNNCNTVHKMLFRSLKKDIESNARQFQDVSDNWIITQETTDKVSAMLFYPEDHSDFIYSIYLNKPGYSFGYFFRIGGTISEIKNSIVVIMPYNAGNVSFLDSDGKSVDIIQRNIPK